MFLQPVKHQLTIHQGRLNWGLSRYEFGNDLWEKARGCGELTWMFSCKPNADSAAHMEEVLRIVSRSLKGSQEPDEYDAKHEYHELHRVAGLNKVMEELTTLEVCVQANTYLYKYCNCPGCWRLGLAG